MKLSFDILENLCYNVHNTKKTTTSKEKRYEKINHTFNCRNNGDEHDNSDFGRFDFN
jgi:hypothetical protein